MMTSKEKLITVLSIVLLTSGLVLIGTTQPAMATPDKGSDCLQCHSAMPPSKANLKTSAPAAAPAAPAAQPAATPAAQPAAQAQPAATLPDPGDTGKLVGKNVNVTATALNVRASGSLQADILGSVQANTTLPVIAEQSGWLQVEYAGGTGWVYGYYVTLAPEQPAASAPTPAPAPAAAAAPAPAAETRPSLVTVPSINEQLQTSRLGSMHWNFFGQEAINGGSHYSDSCISCHSAVAILDDPKAKITDFLKKGQNYAVETVKDPKTGKDVVKFKTATEDGKYANTNFEGITCRVCHVMDSKGLTLRKPNDTCTQCHGLTFDWTKLAGHHIEGDFFAGHGDTYYDPSVHKTIGMQCQDCHTMNAVKHDFEPAKPEDIVRNPKCQTCHQNAQDLENAINTTQSTVQDSLTKLNNKIAAAQKLIADKKATDTKNLVGQAKGRVDFITGDYSNGVHNPQFAAKLINEANKLLDQFDGQSGTSSAPTVTLGNLLVFSQAQSSKLGNMHWDMLESNIDNAADPEQNTCISCHSAVKIVDDPQAQLTDFLKKGERYASGENADGTFNYSTASADGKYVNNHQEGITCRVCHTINEPGGTPGVIGMRRSKEQTCGLCHGRPFNWDTGSGHHIELSFFKGQGSAKQGIPDTPSFKAQMGFVCQTCHVMDNTKHDFAPLTPEQMAANPNCKTCHTTAASAESLIKGIQNEVTSGIEKLKPRLEKAKAYIDKNPKDDAAKSIYTQALAGVSFIEGDYSEGVHNPAFARNLLSRSDKLLNDFEAKYK